MVKNFRKRKAVVEEDEEGNISASLEEIRMLQKQRERTKGVPAGLMAGASAAEAEDRGGEGAEGGEELVLQDTFAQESAITVEDPNMLTYVEAELAKRRGQNVANQNGNVEEKRLAEEDALYAIPEHLQVKEHEGEEASAWTTGIAEVQLPVEYKLKNIEETEQAKRLLQERKPFYSRPRQPTSTLPASFSSDFFQRGREHAEKMRQENPDFRGTSRAGGPGMGGGMGFGSGEHQHHGPSGDQRRQTATDDIMLERFRKRERNRMMRR